MTTAPSTPYRAVAPSRGDGFWPLLRSEWTKLRTVRGWVVALVAVGAVTVAVGLLAALVGSPGPCREAGCVAVRSGGEAVTDAFAFVHQPLDGDGAITVRLTSLTGRRPPARGPAGLEPWAKAGIIVKQSTTPGSAYAAIMATGAHGIRMQDDFIHDTPGRPGAVSPRSPRWLRLTRSGDTVTGEESVDGIDWGRVGVARPAGLSSTVQIGFFVASPDHVATSQQMGGPSSTGWPTAAVAALDHVSVQGRRPGAAWASSRVGGPPGAAPAFRESAGRFVVSGAGDIAPAVGGPEPNTVERSLVGGFAGLIIVIVLGAVFMTTEYRRGLIRTTLAASPRRSRVLAAKAVVVGGVVFVVGLAGAAVALWLVGRVRRDGGHVVLPVSAVTQLRVVAGTAALFAVTAVLALAVGTLLRRSAAAVATVVVLIVLPYLFAVGSVVPTGAAQWLLRVTPAAAFAIQQSIPSSSQVSHAYAPSTGYYPLAPWTGFSVLCLWTVLALGLAVVVLRRRDA